MRALANLEGCIAAERAVLWVYFSAERMATGGACSQMWTRWVRRHRSPRRWAQI